MSILSLLLIVAAAGAGVGAGWLIAAAKLRVATAEAELLRDHAGKTEADLKAARYEANVWRTQAENEGRARAAAEVSASRVSNLEADCADLRNQLMDANAIEAKRTEQNQALREQIELLSTIRTDIEANLKTIVGDSLQNNQTSFLQIANESFAKHKEGASAELNALVLPIRETLQAYQSNLTELERERREGAGALSAELRHVVDVGNSVRNETSKLVNALRASPKTRGRWGENTLRNVLELASLSAYCDFATEQSYVQDGALSRPDVVIRLPGSRSIIIDAKTSMAAYLDSVEAVDETERERHLVLHAQQLRTQVRLLAGKAYWQGLAHTPDFVVMFVPGENFYAAAAERDPDLFEFAFQQHVMIATPVILIALARVIAYNWRQEKAADNAKQVHEIGRELYKRLTTLGGHIFALGSSLKNSVSKYNDFVGSLENSVMPQARRFNELEVEGTGHELPLLAPVEVEPRQPRPQRDLAIAVLAGDAVAEVAC
jgi:DNA recombination protein RmuC